MEELVKYYMDETNRKIAKIETKLDDLTKFKLEMIASARLTALIVSGICGLITLVATVALAFYTARPPR